MECKRHDIEAVVEVVPVRHGDARGYFSETYNAERFRDAGILATFVQDNQSYSAHAGVLRGLHFQSPPFAQDKLVRVLRGSVFDVAVDIRHGSPTFGRWVGTTLSAQAGNQFFVPIGFAHGFVTLEPDTEVAYKVSAYYSPEHDHTLAHDDPDLKIDWPLGGSAAILSSKDAMAPRLKDVPVYFTY